MPSGEKINAFMISRKKIYDKWELNQIIFFFISSYWHKYPKHCFVFIEILGTENVKSCLGKCTQLTF